MKKKIKNLISLILIITLSFNINNYASDEKVTPDMYINPPDNALVEQYLQLYNQNTFHPGENDYFGNNINVVPICRVKINPLDINRQNKIAITFDSAYINTCTLDILDVLDQYDAKSTFFMTAEWAIKNPTLVQEISRRGHEIGNHTFTHPNLINTTEEKVIEEIISCHNAIKSIIGVDMCLFRFPYGAYSIKTLNIVKALGYYPIQWTFDSIDWKNESKEIILSRFAKTDKLIPGAIVLCHNGAIYTPECLPEILELIKSKGLQCVKVSDLIYHHNFYLQNGHQIPYVDEAGNLFKDDEY